MSGWISDSLLVGRSDVKPAWTFLIFAAGLTLGVVLMKLSLLTDKQAHHPTEIATSVVAEAAESITTMPKK